MRKTNNSDLVQQISDKRGKINTQRFQKNIYYGTILQGLTT